MIKLSKILSPELTVCHFGASNKKQVLEKISHLAYDFEHVIKYEEILETFQRRERLGSTAIGHGVAIPHGRIKNLNYPLCILISLTQAIEFDRSNITVIIDLVFGLLVPLEATEEHLNILISLTEKLQIRSYREKLRAAQTNETLYNAAINED